MKTGCPSKSFMVLMALRLNSNSWLLRVLLLAASAKALPIESPSA